MDAEATDLDAVGTADGFDGGGLADDFHEGLAGVAVLVKSTNVAGGEGGGEGDGYGVLLFKGLDRRDQGGMRI